jgi:hypothetical protein
VVQSRGEALADIIADAEQLRSYRKDGTLYCEKCDNLVVRIKTVLMNVNVEDLNDHDIAKIKHIKDLIMSEEFFAKSSADLRNPQTWLGSLND